MIRTLTGDVPSRSAARRRGAAWFAVAAALATVAGCRQSALVGRIDEPTDATVVEDAPGYVDGRLHAHAVFDQVAAIYWFGGDNDPTRLELYVYEKAATCAELSTSGWQDRVRPTDFMGITVGGTTPGTYVVAPEKPPRPGNAFLLHEIDQTASVIDSIGETGSVVITSVKPNETVTGTLSATFSTGTLEGAFTATWCATGVGL